MNPHIDRLDAALARRGEDIILRRIVGTVNTVNIDVVVRASPRAVSGPDELVNGIGQDDLKIILSPTQIKAAQWPGGGINGVAPFNPDRSLPKRGDRVIVKGRSYHVEISNPIAIDDEVVRIELTTKGGASGG